MEITAITNENKASFIHLTSADIYEMIDLKGYFAIGALIGESAPFHPAGILVYHIIKDADENFFVLDWLFVDENDRRHGVGSGLIDGLREVAKDQGAESICADLPVEGLEDLKKLLDKDYESVCMDVSVYEENIEKLRKMLKLPKGFAVKDGDVVTLEEVEFERVRKDINKKIKEQYVSELNSLLKYPKEYFEPDISTLHIDPYGGYDAFLLFHKKPSGKLVAEFYGVSDEAGVSDELAVILKEAMEFIYYKYGGKAEVQFKIRNEEADERIRVLLPELEKRVVKRYAYGITS